MPSIAQVHRRRPPADRCATLAKTAAAVRCFKGAGFEEVYYAPAKDAGVYTSAPIDWTTAAKARRDGKCGAIMLQAMARVVDSLGLLNAAMSSTTYDRLQ